MNKEREKDWVLLVPKGKGKNYSWNIAWEATVCGRMCARMRDTRLST